MIKVFLSILICLSLNASIFQTQINEFDKKFDGAKSSERLKLHHILKNIYIQSIINSNDNLKIKALKRLVLSSRALKLDSSPYEKELEILGVEFELEKLEQKIKKEKKKEIDKQTYSNFKIKEPIKPKPPIITPVKIIDKKDTKPQKINKEESPKEKISNTKTTSILNVKQIGSGIDLKFNKDIANSDIKSFSLNSKNIHRYVFDVKAALMGKTRKYNIKELGKVTVAQYDKSTVRIVISNKKKLDIEKIIDDKKLYIGLDLDSNNKQDFIRKTKFKTNDKIIVIDAGHGGKDAGAVGGKNLYEKDIVLKIALKTGVLLKKKGYKVYYTRVKDRFIKLRKRTKLANDKNADLFVSIHANAAPNKNKYKSMKGVETFFLSPARSQRSKNVAALENKSDIDEMNYFSKQTFLNFLNREKIISSNKLAIDIQKNVLYSIRQKGYKVTDGGVREAPFWVLVGALMPAILLEVGYITNPVEGTRMNTTKYQDAVAKGLSDGIDEYFRKNL